MVSRQRSSSISESGVSSGGQMPWFPMKKSRPSNSRSERSKSRTTSSGSDSSPACAQACTPRSLSSATVASASSTRDR